jgi:integrase
MSTRRRLPPGAKWVTLPSGARRVELVLDVGMNPATGGRRQTRRRFKTVDEAVEAYAKLPRQAHESVYVARSNLTVKQACEDWLAGKRKIRPTTLAGYRDVLKPVIAAYGALPLQRLTKRHLTDLIDQLVAGGLARANGRPRRRWAGRTVNLLLFALGQVLNDALKQGLVVRNVAALVDRLPQRKTEMQTYTPTEARKVLEAARTDRLEAAWHLALYGLRRGEIAGMLWSDIDLEAGTLTVREALVTVAGRPQASAPKTERGARTLPLTPALAAALTRTRRRQAGEQLRAGPAWHDSGHVVANEIGEPLHPDTISDRWDALVKRAEVQRIRLHDARHTCGTLMHLEGVPVAVIAAWLGHASADFTMRVYVHSQPDALAAAAEKLGVVTRA